MAASRSIESGVLRILDGSRGLSDWYPPRLDDTQLAEAWDVEFWDGTVAGRRHGCVAQAAGGGPDFVGHALYVHTPTTKRADDRLCMAFTSGVDGNSYLQFYDSAWASNGVGAGPDAHALDWSQGVDFASLHGKLFIATKSTENRLHVYSGSLDYIRATGIRPIADSGITVTPQIGGAQTYFDARSFRVRYTRQVSGVTLLRSEPSDPPTPFVPGATTTGAVVTILDSGLDPWITHWELEELSGGNWYRIATTLTTSTATTTLPLAAVATTGVLSEDVGDYTLQYSARWLTVDEDRLILGGSFDEEAKSARVSWTPIGMGSGDGQVGVGNDERLPSDVAGYLDFDMLDGGGLTGIKAWEGKVIVFKRSQVHQMVRSSARTRAYLPDTLSRRHGAIPFSIVEGTDVDGVSCLYFLDPEVGPMQLGTKGLRVLAPTLQRTWRSMINLNSPTINAVSVTYHAEKRQVWWHVATGTAPYQNLRWMYSVESDGVVFHTLPLMVKSATAWLRKPTLLHDTIGGSPVLIGQGDITSAVVDYTVPYRAFVVTKAYQLGALLRRWQVDAAILEAMALPGAVVSIVCRRDFGQERRAVVVALTPPAATPGVPLLAIPVDNSYMTEAISMQFEIGDAVPLTVADVGGWQIHGLTLAWTLGSPSAGRG
jgi:hypothetical protein